MRDYGKRRRDREPMTRELYGLGLSCEEIAEIIGWSSATVAHDIQRFGGPVAFPDRPSKAEDVYAAVLARYAEIIRAQGQDWRSPHAEQATLRDVLASHLGAAGIMDKLFGIAYTLELFSTPQCPPERKGYLRLINDVFHVPRRLTSVAHDGRAYVLDHWHDRVLAIALKEETVPRTRHHLFEMLAAPWIRYGRSHVMPIWDDRVYARIDRAIETLDRRQSWVLHLRYGIGVERAQTLDEIAKQYRITRGRVGDIEKQALRRLGHITRVKLLQPLIQPVGDALQRQFKLEEERCYLEQTSNGLSDDFPIAILLKSAEELDLSVRSTNALSNGRIGFIGDLVQRTECDLLKQKNFGRRSLAEIKDKLKGLHPSLMLGFGDWVPSIAAFNKIKAEKAGSPPST